ncbi:MAG: beta-ketoacyl-[acyl-carrier-protein] synthase family protein [Desulfosalsimonas sp.]|uniref:beta-ketoacyl-[acyl-carrier-protein] synthase family protein n=1 Tax=Desulfosalsimonas sp. TaxID=3073848 RepID=UPI003970E7EE
MKAPLNRRVFVIGYAGATPLGRTFDRTWNNAAAGRAGFGQVTRCSVQSLSRVVGEIPDWDPAACDFVDSKEAHNWNADFVILTMDVCRAALADSGLEINDQTASKTACMVGSALNGTDAFRKAAETLRTKGALRVSPYLLPNLCANLPAGKAGMMLGFTGPVLSPQGACASGNFAIGLGARMIRDGDCDFVLAGGVDTCIMPEIIHGFANMNATIKVGKNDRAYNDPSLASRPFSVDRKGMVLSEGCGVLVLAAEEAAAAHGLVPRAEVAGVGWSSDACHFTLPNGPTIVRAISAAIDDAGLAPADIGYVNAHGTSTRKGDFTEIQSLRAVFGNHLECLPVSSNKSQIGHTLGASAAIEAALGIEGMRRGVILPTINHIPDPALGDIDVVPDSARAGGYECFLSNAFGFGGTNCCIVFKGV